MAFDTLPYISPEEYLKAEREAESKNEYYEGEVLPMPRVTPRHVRIATNLTARLGEAVAGSSCQVFGSGMRVHVPTTDLFSYPAASVVCGTPVFFQTDNLENPIVIVEVLPMSLFLDYQSLSSLREYLLVSQQPRLIFHCARGRDQKWHIENIGEEQGGLRLTSIGVDLSFDQIYAGAESLR